MSAADPPGRPRDVVETGQCDVIRHAQPGELDLGQRASASMSAIAKTAVGGCASASNRRLPRGPRHVEARHGHDWRGIRLDLGLIQR